MIVHEHIGTLEVHEKYGAVVLEVPNAETHTIVIEPPTKLASYDLRILNSKGYELYKLKNRIGRTKKRVETLVAGNCTIELSNVSHSGDYAYYFSMKS